MFLSHPLPLLRKNSQQIILIQFFMVLRFHANRSLSRTCLHCEVLSMQVVLCAEASCWACWLYYPMHMWIGFSLQTVRGWFVFCSVILGTCCLWVSKITNGFDSLGFFSVVLPRSLFLLVLLCKCVYMSCWFLASLFFICKISNI
jgi:hypothetical protein